MSVRISALARKVDGWLVEVVSIVGLGRTRMGDGV